MKPKTLGAGVKGVQAASCSRMVFSRQPLCPAIDTSGGGSFPVCSHLQTVSLHTP